MHQEDRNHSPKTVRWYRDMLGKFVEYVGNDSRLRDLTPDAVRGYQHNVQATDASKFTRHAYMRTLKTFVRWLEREEYIEARLAHRIEMPKVPRYDDVTIDVLNDDEISRLLEALAPATDVGSRNRAIVCLMLESGLRLDEVVTLRLGDVRAKEMYVRVHGKGDKESYVPIGPTTQKALMRYAEHFRLPAKSDELSFFLNIYGEPLGYEAVKSTFDRLAKVTGIVRLHPHLLRHTAATRMLSNGADVHSVQRLLRHSDIRTTLRYAHLAPEHLQAKMQQFSPLTGLEHRRRRMHRGTASSQGPSRI
jgi:integrase/recombinase XerC/integrase/recombinase XerD